MKFTLPLIITAFAIMFGFFALTELERPDANSFWGLAAALSFMVAGSATDRAWFNA